MPLLQGRVEVKRLIFEGAELRLQAKDDGAANWTFPTETDSAQQTTIEDLRLDDVRLTDGLISFQGAEGQAPFTLENVDAALKLESLDTPAALNAEFDYRDQRIDLRSSIGLPRAVLEKGATPLNARMQSQALETNFEGSFNAADGALDGRLEASGASLRRLLAWMGAPMTEGGGFGAYRLQATMRHRRRRRASPMR